jgi:Family of unknown function (DUF5941)
VTPLQVYRDDGPVAAWLGRAVGRALPVGEIPLTLVGAVPLVVILAAPASTLATGAVALAALVLVLLAGAGSARAGKGRFAWIAPPLLRGLEYGTLIKLTAMTAPDAMPLCYAVLAVLAFHHYDNVYRLRHQRTSPPAWTRLVGGGWDGRLLVASALALGGVLEPGLIVGAVVLGPVFVAESVVSWLRFVGAERPTVYEDEDVQDA